MLDKIKSLEFMVDFFYGRHMKGVFGKEGVFFFFFLVIEVRKVRDFDRSAKVVIVCVAK